MRPLTGDARRDHQPAAAASARPALRGRQQLCPDAHPAVPVADDQGHDQRALRLDQGPTHLDVAPAGRDVVGVRGDDHRSVGRVQRGEAAELRLSVG